MLVLVLGAFLVFLFFMMNMGFGDEARLAEDWLEAVQAAEGKYYSIYGRYSGSLEELGPSGAQLLNDRFSRRQLMHVVIELGVTKTGYSVSIYPIIWAIHGYRS